MSGERPDWPEIHRRISAAHLGGVQDVPADSDAARAVLRSRAEALSREGQDAAPAEDSVEVVGFMIGSEKYGVESRFVREVYPLNELVTVPGTPSFVLGIVNVRGRVLSVIDLGKLFDLPAKEMGEYDRVIVISDEKMEFGLWGTAILGVMLIPRAAMQPSLPTLTGIREKYLLGVTGERMAVLDAKRLLSDAGMIVHEGA
jgi:purine-binding chemotaxis protein CheW